MDKHMAISEILQIFLKLYSLAWLIIKLEPFFLIKTACVESN